MHVLCECAFRSTYGAGPLVKGSFAGDKAAARLVASKAALDEATYYLLLTHKLLTNYLKPTYLVAGEAALDEATAASGGGYNLCHISVTYVYRRGTAASGGRRRAPTIRPLMLMGRLMGR
eukprot:scaffold14699_cov54-Phaeocystis_antarctica.AAC.1